MRIQLIDLKTIETERKRTETEKKKRNISKTT